MDCAVSIVILTKNEANDLPGCLDSIAWCDDIHLVDSGSSDGTLSIARSRDVQCYQNPFEGFGVQRNWALDNCALRHQWVLFLDADERSTPAFECALRQELARAAGDTAGFYCCWKTMLDGKWLKYSDRFPKWQFRLLKRGKARFENFGHGQRETDLSGEIRYLREPYLHFSFSKGWTQWLERHNRYSSEEAQLRISRDFSWGEIFSRHSAIRLKSLRVLASRTPGWPLLRFILRYFIGLGFLEGRAGFVYCVNLAYYEFMIQIKMRELR